MKPDPCPLLAQLEAIDWQAAWYAPYRKMAAKVIAQLRRDESLPSALNLVAYPEHSISFTEQNALEKGMAYEQFIYENAQVPTRNNLHDFFNGLVWLRFPKIKARLNALQYGEIRAHGIPRHRGALRDALTLFDENAVFLSQIQHGAIIQALKNRDWRAAFQTHRALWHTAPIVFGHALLEKLVSPYKSITGHVYPAGAAIDIEANFVDFDLHLSQALSAASLLPKPFAALPVLGVPGWWAGNEKEDFYTDSGVFRPPRT